MEGCEKRERSEERAENWCVLGWWGQSSKVVDAYKAKTYTVRVALGRRGLQGKREGV